MVIGNYNNKGGVGKSTLTAHIGFRAADTGKSITIVDADRQLNAMAWLSGHQHNDEDSFELGSVQVTTSLDSSQHSMIVIDCPPAFEVTQRFPDVDVWLVPVGGRFALDGAINVISEVRRLEKGSRIVLVANKVNPNTEIGKQELDEIHKLGVELFQLPIPQSDVVRKAELLGVPAWKVPYGVRANTTQALQALADWVLRGCNARGTYA
jgi:cellulose biosynthesis protein BcsQ